MFEKEQPYPSFWQSVASTIRGERLSKRHQLLRVGAIALLLVLFGLDHLILLVRHLR